jgi:hypothetical protein
MLITAAFETFNLLIKPSLKILSNNKRIDIVGNVKEGVLW